MAGTRDPHRFAGRMGINSGPIPIKRWVQQPNVQVTTPKTEDMPDAGKPQEQGNGRRSGKE